MDLAFSSCQGERNGAYPGCDSELRGFPGAMIKACQEALVKWRTRMMGDGQQSYTSPRDCRNVPWCWDRCFSATSLSPAIIMVLIRDHQHIYFSINIFSKHKTPLQKHQTLHFLGMGRPGFFVCLSESLPYSEAMCVFIPTDLAHIVQVRLSKAFKYFSVS